MGSITAKLVEHSSVTPVWVIDGKVPPTGFIAALDGSEGALRALDHLGFMIGEDPEARVTLFHALPKAGTHFGFNFGKEEASMEQLIAQSEKQHIDHFLVRASETLNLAGVGDKQIQVKVSKPTGNVGKTIVDEVKGGDYGSVLIGRRGTSKAFFMGSISRYVIDNCSNRALWLVS
jgi:nucleotide-binding universal stress UspA family protein